MNTPPGYICETCNEKFAIWTQSIYAFDQVCSFCGSKENVSPVVRSNHNLHFLRQRLSKEKMLPEDQ